MNYSKLYVIDETGNVTCLYHDDLPKLGTQKVTRASQVEPEPDGNGWFVQLSDNPLNGEFANKVIARNVQRREDAIKIEIDFIQKNILGKGVLA